MLRLLLSAITAALAAFSVAGNQLVVDATDSLPVGGATFFNPRGNVVCAADISGQCRIPDNALYPLTVKALGYEDLVITDPTDTLRLTPSPIPLAEVVASASTDRNVTFIKAYLRKYTTVIIDNDTLNMFSEGDIYFLITDDKVKGFKGSRKSHPICMRSFKQERVDGKIVVKVDDDYDNPVNDLSFKLIKAPSIPSALCHDTIGIVEKPGESGIIWSVARSKDGISFSYDRLAEFKNHKISGGSTKLLGIAIAIDESTRSYQYGLPERGTSTMPYYLLQGASDSFEMTFSGKLVRKTFKTEGEVVGYYYEELFPYQIDFLTVDEAKKLQKEPPEQATVFIPEAARAGGRPLWL